MRAKGAKILGLHNTQSKKRHTQPGNKQAKRLKRNTKGPGKEKTEAEPKALENTKEREDNLLGLELEHMNKRTLHQPCAYKRWEEKGIRALNLDSPTELPVSHSPCIQRIQLRTVRPLKFVNKNLENLDFYT